MVGIGNPYRSDDAAGWAVIDALEGQVHGSIQLSKQRGDIAELLDVFSTSQTVFLVDACLSTEGGWQRIDLCRQPLPEENTQTSTHGLSVAQAIALAKNLEIMPPKLILYAIAGDQYGVGGRLSPHVEKSVKQVVKEILNEKELHA